MKKCDSPTELVANELLFSELILLCFCVSDTLYVVVSLHLYRDDFKGVLHEVRRNNRNTLSGLSLDSITEQVKAIIDSKEKGRGSAHGGKGATGGGGGGKGRQNKTKSTSRQQVPIST